MTEDSYAGDANNPLTLNRYTYGINNPLRYLDPTGYSIEDFVNKIKELCMGDSATVNQKTQDSNIESRDKLIKDSTTKNPNGNANVIEAQASLLVMGYNIGKDDINGQTGTDTIGAIKEFQLAVGLEPTGIIDDATKSAMWVAVAAGLKRDDLNKLAVGWGHGATDVSDDGIKFIAGYEGFSSKVYKDARGLDTIGYGHLLKKNESFPNGITKEQALALMKQDLQSAIKVVKDSITVPLTQEQFDALVSLAYNTGYIGTNLANAINQGNYSDIESRIKAYKYAGGKVLKGLGNRRADEWELYSTSDYKRDHY